MRRVGVDIGGTFTDLVAFDDEKGELVYLKVLTTPREPWRGFMEALAALGWSLDSIEVIVHASTLGINMFLGQVGLERPRVALITNKGFRDILEIGRQNRPELYNLFFSKPEPLVPRSLRIGVGGRIDARGREIEPLDEEEVARIAERLCGKVDVFVVSFLHSYINPVHEKRAKEIIGEKCPGAIIVAGHEVDPQPKEYERTSTAVVNAVLRPLFSKYTTVLERVLRRNGYQGPLLVMQSNGGLAAATVARERPAAFIESGPAAGTIATAFFAKLLGYFNALAFDMGGTTAKASAIINGEPLTVSEYEVGAQVKMGRVLRGSGYPVRYPFIDIVEVSAGGGTIAWIDQGGALRVGPLSAGADPGPACYGRGGEEPTITDANLVLGRLPEELAGGRIRLHRDLAEKAIGRLAERLGSSVVETAYSIVKIANTVMSRALRLVTVERGYNPRDFALFAYGGAGPLHAVALADELGVREVVVPPMPGVFSALGLLLADYRHDLHQAVMKEASSIDDVYLETIFSELEDRVKEMLRGEGVEEDKIVVHRMIDVKYWRQAYELTVPYHGSLEQSLEEFKRLHRARYGYTMPNTPIVVVNARVTGYGIVAKPEIPQREAVPYRPEPGTLRRVFFGDTGWVLTPVYRRTGLRPGAEIEGPAVIEADDSTVLVPPRHMAYVDEYTAIRITSI